MKFNDNHEPFFISEEVEAELVAAGYEFEPPICFATICPPILGSLDDMVLEAWPGRVPME
ncbi:MAG: hypothetical protein CMK74_04755 [Pseudomonadales bacterium]|nr:hypothetical protein [Pseudomonadales bacterium]|tara:strand:- start:330 stop:509 length:180 start_codon:yes stop_codon:yes gene_type:complete